ncbi:MAG: hypothetical protein CSA26_02630 [Desulfobacterales bacterium]|nr:MAG: hypothetical protein CSA26_02630 [Desulfobacterales bacterium]
MNLTDALKSHKNDILTLWIDRTLDSYTSPGFFKKAKDHFANPVGVNTTAALTTIFDLLVDNSEPSAYADALDQIIRIRAVQALTPAQAVAPLLELKWIVKSQFSAKQDTQPLLMELDEFDCEIDRIALMGFNIYMECREQLYRCRIQEIKSGSHVLTDSGCPSKLVEEKTAATNT